MKTDILDERSTVMDIHAPMQRPISQLHRILVVEDDRLIRQTTISVLVRSGYLVRAAEDGERGWDAVCASHFDLLVTDNAMPKMSGVELVEKMRSARMTTPVILASGTLPTRELMQNQQLGLAAALDKPFSCEELLRTVAQVLLKSRPVGAPRYWAI
jgi:DNA-binding NtrC family response regulator